MGVNQDKKTTAAPARDLNHVAPEGCAFREFPLAAKRTGDGGSVPVVIKQSVLEAIHEHGGSRTDVEVCGVLVGKGYRDEYGPYVYVEGMIRGNYAGSQLAQVTFTAETWNYMQEVMDRAFPDKRIIGWYHTHPGFGIFLSPMDLFIHENFFSASDQLAIVYDPLGRKDGLFVWRQDKATEEPFLLENDVAQQSAPSAEVKPVEQSFLATATTDGKNLSTRLDGLAKQQRRLWLGLLLVLLTAIVWPLYLRLLPTELDLWSWPWSDAGTKYETPSGDSADVGR